MPRLLVLAVLAANASSACGNAIVEGARSGSVAHDLLASGDWLTSGCVIRQDDETLRLTLSAEGAFVECRLSGLSAPAMLQFEMKVDAQLDSPYVSWSTTKDPSWRGFNRIPVDFTNGWRKYSIPIESNGQLAGLRIVPNAASGQVEMRKLSITPIELSDDADGSQAVEPVGVGPIELAYIAVERRYHLADERTGRVWTSEPLPSWISVDRAESAGRAIVLYLHNAFTDQRMTLRSEVAPEAVVRFRLIAPDAETSLSGWRSLPPRFSADWTGGSLVFCDRSCGVLLDQRDDTYAHWPLRVYGSTHCLDMPWVGVFNRESRDGMMFLVESPEDAEVSFTADQEGRHWPEMRWLPTMDRLGYERVCSLHLTDGGGYVRLAKLYRQTLAKTGRLKTLAEKAEQKPSLERLRQGPLLWAGRDARKQVELARSLGVLGGVVNNCMRRSQVEPLKQLGFLVGRYDSYTDIFEGSVDFQRDDINRTAVRPRPGQPPMNGWQFEDGRQMSWRSSAFWLTAAKSYVPRHLEKSGHNARFVDVAVAAAPVEDHAPGHRFDRRQDLRQRRELLAYLNALGLVLGTEHGNDWAADIVDYHEGSLSGPFWWSSWPAGHLHAPDRAQLSSQYLKYGMGYDTRVPLWQLVFHDCLVSSWYWGDNAGMLYGAAPELATRKDLITLLYGGTQLLWMDGHGYGWPQNQGRWLRSHHDTAKFFQCVAFAEMLTHEFLSEDYALQRCAYSNGAVVTVNFSGEPRALPGHDSVTLAPYGYVASGPGVEQKRVWENGRSLTSVVTPGWLMLESGDEIRRHGVEFAGLVTLFELTPEEWRFVGEPGNKYTLSPSELTGWPGATQIEIRSVGPDGVPGQVLFTGDAATASRLESSLGASSFSIVRLDAAAPAAPDGHSALGDAL